jgi:hypothetical protein
MYYTDMEQTIWTPKAVSRPTPEGYAVLAIKANWNPARRSDLFWFELDGGTFEWYRRGAAMFTTRAECVQYISSKGWPLG